MKNWHWLVGILLITALTLLLEIPADTWLTSATLSLILGATALAYMAVSCLLASRWRVVENLFGGLDRVYDTHKWLGIWALVFASYHLVFKANLEVWNSVPIVELSKYWTRMVRQLSYVALGMIVLLALNRNIPYSVWRWWHKLSGPLFLIVILHGLSFKSPITLLSPAGIWLGVLCVLGVLAALYKLLLYPFVARAGEYRVINVRSDKGAVHLTLAPIDKGFAFKAGQFAFLSFKDKGLREPHPFTIACAHRENGHLEFVIRALGTTPKPYARAGQNRHDCRPLRALRALQTPGQSGKGNLDWRRRRHLALYRLVARPARRAFRRRHPDLLLQPCPRLPACRTTATGGRTTRRGIRGQ